jgi:hypothetical protein
VQTDLHELQYIGLCKYLNPHIGKQNSVEEEAPASSQRITVFRKKKIIM